MHHLLLLTSALLTADLCSTADFFITTDHLTYASLITGLLNTKDVRPLYYLLQCFALLVTTDLSISFF